MTKRLAARVSFSGTQRDGTVHNIVTDKYTNDINNLGLRTQFLIMYPTIHLLRWQESIISKGRTATPR
ncbi:hypothetical protein LWM68_38895 [Niabella sp. W65]|nr:hypothetical protein [Niabella sp. W65]MCH7368180.1 hypothetical protein [Niabella sp. W65]